MARNTIPHAREHAANTFKFPELHDDVFRAVRDDVPSAWFNRNGSKHNAVNEYSTNVMGRFTCVNMSCSNKTWGSKMVAVLIRGFKNNGYDAIVFNQRCISCRKLGTFILDEDSYVERVAYRLKKWAGVNVELPFYNSKDGPPHESDLCEGCKRGFCKRRSSNTYRS